MKSEPLDPFAVAGSATHRPPSPESGAEAGQRRTWTAGWIAVGLVVPVLVVMGVAAGLMAAMTLTADNDASALSSWPAADEPHGAVEGTAVTDGLEPGLATAFAAAVVAAEQSGHHLTLTSGYRSPEDQQRLLDEAIAEYGSEREARRWVFPPEESMHVRGLAVDVGDGPAADWLETNGNRWGLCRTLAWEWWHFEWRPEWERDQTCPGPVDDPADAPR